MHRISCSSPPLRITPDRSQRTCLAGTVSAYASPGPVSPGSSWVTTVLLIYLVISMSFQKKGAYKPTVPMLTSPIMLMVVKDTNEFLPIWTCPINDKFRNNLVNGCNYGTGLTHPI